MNGLGTLHVKLMSPIGPRPAGIRSSESEHSQRNRVLSSTLDKGGSGLFRIIIYWNLIDIGTNAEKMPLL